MSLHKNYVSKFYFYFYINKTQMKIPASLFRAGRCFIFEPSNGIKANLLRTLANIPASRMNKVYIFPT